jgi:hypothetical protein
LLILSSIPRLRIRLVLACNHYQTLVCCCQAEMSLSGAACGETPITPIENNELGLSYPRVNRRSSAAK